MNETSGSGSIRQRIKTYLIEQDVMNSMMFLCSMGRAISKSCPINIISSNCSKPSILCHFKIAVNSIYLDSEDLHFKHNQRSKNIKSQCISKNKVDARNASTSVDFFLFLKTFLAGCPIYLTCSSHSKTNMMNFRFNFKRVMTIN